MRLPRHKPAARLSWGAETAWIKPRRTRFRELLCRAERDGGIPLHCEGGLAFRGDVRALVQRGLLRIERVAYDVGWASDLEHPYKLRRTIAKITPAGIEVVRQDPRP